MDVPAPVNRPGSPRPYYFCDELSKEHELFLGTLSKDVDQLRWLDEDPAYKRIFREVQVLPSPPSKIEWWNRQRHRLSFSVYYYTKNLHPVYHQQMTDRITQWVRDKKIDLLYVNGMEMAQYVSPTLGIPTVSDVCDCLSLLFRKTAAAKKSPILKLRFLLESYSLARWERAMARAFTFLIVISSLDEKGLKAVAPYAKTLVIPNGVDVDYFKPQGSPQRMRIVFTGVMSYPPNEDAALYFAESVFPLIKRKVPEAEFWCVGKGPCERLRALTAQDGIHVTGTVEDVREYLSSARVFVCPLLYGAGMKNKILSAMAMERPVVATSVSLESLATMIERDALVGDTPEQLAAEVERVLRDDGLAQRLGRSGRALVVEHYSWETAFKILRPAIGQFAPHAY
jgi:sugar transferase (PEP-CTERM/EpsH1 system associated)